MKDKILHIELNDGVLPLSTTARFKANEEKWNVGLSNYL